MPVAATVKPFGRLPTTVVLQTSDNFDGTAPTGTPTIAGGVVAYPEQAGGGQFKLHDKVIEILDASSLGGGSLTIVRKVQGTTALSVPVSGLSDLKGMQLPPGEWLEISSTGGGAKQLIIKAREMPAAVGF